MCVKNTHVHGEKVKGNIHLVTDLEGWGRGGVEDSSTSFFNLSARWGWVVKAPATLPPREDTQYPLYWAVTDTTATKVSVRSETKNRPKCSLQ